MYFGYKHVETGPSCSHKLVTFLKYRMPLTFFTILMEQKNINAATLK